MLSLEFFRACMSAGLKTEALIFDHRSFTEDRREGLVLKFSSIEVDKTAKQQKQMQRSN
jgi:hypothetical protein